MKTAIITSSADIAGTNIREALIKGYQFKPTGASFDGTEVLGIGDILLYQLTTDTIHTEGLDSIDAERIIFATRHRSSEGTKSLCVHTPGNFGKAEYGGKDGQLCTAEPSLMRHLFQELLSRKGELPHTVTMESTHHGPFLEKPCCFVEIGSDEECWKDKEAAKVVADAIMAAATSNGRFEAVIVFGGGHYNPAANKILERTSLAVGHICPKHHLAALDEDLLDQMLGRSLDKPAFAVLDWKGLGPEKMRLLQMLELYNLEYKRIDKM